ncbi:MAG: AAA family ATPase [Acinetobacter sp.]|uniref:AAA family ATPase n=1 Tax=Acinetobacter sp. TaxID=472 RepID=UPI0026E01143|nr:AAA family ATPase [Acinetobacter sp.]MDO5541704.1 AAA family ATPase [Acinetobacter sp.]
MKFSVEVKNFGKIKDARVNLAPFTVISGTNSSGKSFLSRALYTFFSTINKDYVTLEARKLFSSIFSLLRFGFHTTKNPSARIVEVYEELESVLFQLDNTINATLDGANFLEQHANNLNIAGKLELVEDLVQTLQLEIDNKKKYQEFYERVTLSLRQIKSLKEAIKNPVRILVRKLDEEFKNNLKENFQVLSLADLKSNNSNQEKIEFNIDGLGEIKIEKEAIDFNLSTNAISEFQELRNVVFVESPIYWKLRKPLMEIQKRSRSNSIFAFYKQNSELTGVPKYFYDLMDLLNLDIKSDNEGDEFLNKVLNKINNTLSGELDISDNGEIYFKDKNCSKNINLNLTATGVANLGIIGLLLKKNVIGKGSYVFIDEPEVNLHPAWQQIMIETLYELSRNGISVVIATHSIDMIKYIENIMDKLDYNEVNEHFAINRLSNDGISISDELDPRESLLSIKDDLGKPFYDLVLSQGW